MPLNAVTLKAAFFPVMTVSYAILGGGTPVAPTFTFGKLDNTQTLTLTTTPVRVAADIGSVWVVSSLLFTPTPLPGEDWPLTHPAVASGNFTAGSTIVFKYQNQYYLTMQVNPSGTGSTTPNTSGWYNAGQKVTIGATATSIMVYGHPPIQEYNFLNWTGSGAGSYSGRCRVAGCSSAAWLTMNAPITETANFGVIITVTSTPTGAGYVTVDGAAVKTPWTTTWVIGSMHTIAAVSPVSCGTGCRYIFTAWSDSGTQSHTIAVPSSLTTYSATFQKQYLLTMNVNPSGTGVAAPTTGWYNVGVKVPLTATANTGYGFLSWTGSGTGSYSGTSSSPTITMNAAITETANFGVTITITSTPTGSGYVTVDGVAVKTPQTFTWVVGSKHTITANSPVSCGTGCQYIFTAWSDAGSQSHTITVPSTPTTYTAIFQQQYYLTMKISGPGSATPGSGWYNAGATVTLTATPKTNHTFNSWTGTGNGSYAGTMASPTITMNAAITETATFT
jgi:hypothetical protein